jgi:hypothetical protein
VNLIVIATLQSFETIITGQQEDKICLSWLVLVPGTPVLYLVPRNALWNASSKRQMLTFTNKYTNNYKKQIRTRPPNRKAIALGAVFAMFLTIGAISNSVEGWFCFVLLLLRSLQASDSTAKGSYELVRLLLLVYNVVSTGSSKALSSAKYGPDCHFDDAK